MRQIPVTRLHRLTVEQYEKMTATGILGAADRVELWHGWIVEKVTQNPPHNVAIDCTRDALLVQLPPDWLVREQKAVGLADSMPEPDLVIVKGPRRRYTDRHPRPQDIGLIIEVADSSLGDDRRVKGPMYARDRIPIYWIVNIVDAKVEVYTQPKGGKKAGYRERCDYQADEAVPLMIEDRELALIPVRDLLP